MELNEKKWDLISQRDKKERDGYSSSSLLIDDMIISLVKKGGSNQIIVDYGAGTGLQTRLLSGYVKKIVAYEPTKQMRDVFCELTNSNQYPNVSLTNDLEFIDALRDVDTLICSRAFEHIENIDEVLQRFARILKPMGVLILSLSHPVKFSGDWIKNNGGDYDFYRIDNYFNEGLTLRKRDDHSGNQQMEGISTYHRTVSTYLNAVINAGFRIIRVDEPVPNICEKERLPKLYQRLSKIPNCLVIICVNNG